MFILPFDLYSFLCGPALIFTIFVFTCGCIYRIIQFVQITRSINRPMNALPFPALDDRSILFKGKNPIQKILMYLKLKRQRTILGPYPIMGTVSIFFHILLFITPLFLSAHNVIIDQNTGISLFSLPDILADKFTIIVILICIFFLIRRIVNPGVRLLTTAVDYSVLLMVMLPFISAFAAYHQFFNYKLALYIHIIAGEIAIMAVPFTKLGHMLFFIFSRFFVTGEYNLKYANRSW